MNNGTRIVIGGLVILSLTVPANRTEAKPPPGPPWHFAGEPARPSERPAGDAPDKHFVFSKVGESGAPLGVSVSIGAAVAKPAADHLYDLYYQFRVHTKKNEFGPILGTADFPKGKPFLLRQTKAEYDWIEFYEAVDINRKDLSGLLNLPTPGKNQAAKEVVLRVEPQLYDNTEKKYLTPPKTPAVILIASVVSSGRVTRLVPLHEWLVECSKERAEEAVALLADLDEYDTVFNEVEAAIFKVLSMKDAPNKTKLLYLNAIPAAKLNWKSHYHLMGVVQDLAKGDNAELKAAAQRKLDEAKR